MTAGDGHPTKLLPMTRASTLGLEAGQAGPKSRGLSVLGSLNANSFLSSGPKVENKKR